MPLNFLEYFNNQNDLTLKVHKAISDSDSLENHIIMNCIGPSFILNYLICIIMCSEKKHQQICKNCTEKQLLGMLKNILRK